MTRKVANLLGLNHVYVILAHELTGHDSIVLDPVFVKKDDAEAYARQYEKENNLQMYTEIYRMELK